MKKKKNLLKEFFGLGGIVGTPAINNISIAPAPRPKYIKSPKLKELVEEVYGQQDEDVDVKGFLSEVNQYGSLGKMIYREGNLQELAQRLSKMAETAKTHAIKETEDWMDKISVNKNMKSLNGYAQEFNKIASEASGIQGRMEDLYENMGFILGKYYDIQSEGGCGKKKKDIKEEDSKYQEFFRSALKKYGVTSPEDLDDGKKKAFYTYIENNWQAADEK